jgi:hypothetical protein
MQPLSIVEHLDVFEDHRAGLLSGLKVNMMMDKLILERADEALGTSVVEAVPRAPRPGNAGSDLWRTWSCHLYKRLGRIPSSRAINVAARPEVSRDALLGA